MLLWGCCTQPTVSTAVDATSERPTVLIAAPALCQHPDFPTGCETVTAVMALQYAGESISPAAFIDNYLTCNDGFYRKGLFLYGPDPYRVFVGNPRIKASYGCMAPVIEAALVRYFQDEQRVTNTTGTDIPALCQRYIDRGVPVILWATGDMTSVKTGGRWRLEDGRLFTWPSGEHCLLLVGYNEDNYFFNDPKYGLTLPYPKGVTQQRYAEMGLQSLVIE